MSECDNTGTAVPHITVKECPIIHGPNCDKIWEIPMVRQRDMCM